MIWTDPPYNVNYRGGAIENDALTPASHADLLERAFAALGPGPTARELSLVAETLIGSGDEEALAEIVRANTDEEAWKRLIALADANGSSGFVALDLRVAVGVAREPFDRADESSGRPWLRKRTDPYSDSPAASKPAHDRERAGLCEAGCLRSASSETSCEGES